MGAVFELHHWTEIALVQRFAHTGEVAGVVGQTVAGLASLGGAFLVWTGISLALRRLRAWLGRRSGATVQSLDPLTETAAGD